MQLNIMKIREKKKLILYNVEGVDTICVYDVVLLLLIMTYYP